jgi:hypothetical protein
MLAEPRNSTAISLHSLDYRLITVDDLETFASNVLNVSICLKDILNAPARFELHFMLERNSDASPENRINLLVAFQDSIMVAHEVSKCRIAHSSSYSQFRSSDRDSVCFTTLSASKWTLLNSWAPVDI